MSMNMNMKVSYMKCWTWKCHTWTWNEKVHFFVFFNFYLKEHNDICLLTFLMRNTFTWNIVTVTAHESVTHKNESVTHDMWHGHEHENESVTRTYDINNNNNVFIIVSLCCFWRWKNHTYIYIWYWRVPKGNVMVIWKIKII